MPLFGPPNIENLKAKGKINGLINALFYEKDRHIRQEAALALGELGDPTSVEPLVKALKDSDRFVSAAAVDALIAFGPVVIPQLLNALQAEEWQLRKAAADALGQLKDETAVKPLIQALHDTNVNVQAQAATALGNIGDSRAILPLINLLGVRNRNVKKAAEYALSSIGEPAVESLFVLANDQTCQIEVRQSAVEILGRVKETPNIDKLIDLLADDQLRVTTMKILGWMGDNAIDPLLKRLDDKKLNTHVIPVLDALKWKPGRNATGAKYWIAKHEPDKCARIGAAAVEPLIKALNNIAYNKRVSVVETLGKIGGPQVIEVLISSLQEKDDRVRTAAEKVLGLLSDSRAVEPLITNLPSAQAAASLGKLGNDRAVEPLIAMLDSDPQEARLAAVESLGMLANALAVPSLIGVLNSKEPKLREKAAQALGKIRHLEAVPPLIEALQDTEEQVRLQAAWALGQIADPQAIEPLLALLPEENQELRHTISRALVKIGPHVVRYLVAALPDSDFKTRQVIAEILSKLEWQPTMDEIGAMYWITQKKPEACIAIGAPAVEPLIGALVNEDWQVRKAAAETLGKLQDKRAVEPLISLLQDSSQRVRSSAIQALGLLADTRAVEPLIDLLPDSDALLALGKLGDQRSVQPILHILLTGSEESIIAAAKALGDLGDPVALDHLIVLLGVSHKLVRQAAANALVTLYSKASLSEQQKQSILNQHGKITHQHEDGSFGNHTDIDHSKGGRCEAGHEDKTEHVDRGIGVDFPL